MVKQVKLWFVMTKPDSYTQYTMVAANMFNHVALNGNSFDACPSCTGAIASGEHSCWLRMGIHVARAGVKSILTIHDFEIAAFINPPVMTVLM